MPDDMTPRSGVPGPESASAWYRTQPVRTASGRTGPAPVQPAPVRPQPLPKKRRWPKVLALSLCGVVLAAAVAVAVVHSGLAQRIYDMSLSRYYRFDDGYGFEADGGFDFSFGVDDGALPSDEYDDFRAYFEDYYTGSNEITMPAAPTGAGVTLRLQAAQGEALSLQEIYERVSPAVVGITTYLEGEEYAWGTGVVFDSAGYILTNTHILQGCDAAQVVFPDGSTYEALLVGADEASDVAVVTIETDGGDLPCADFGRSTGLRVGDEVVAIGNPLGQEYAGTMTNGIISAIDRNVTYEGHPMTLLQTNAALNEGNSGGPLINDRGQVIGITNMKIMSSYFTSVEGIGFAIPSAVIKQIADQLIATGVVPGEPAIGIVAGPVSAEAMELFDMPKGLYITEVSEGSDALEKGLLAGDVITAVNGEPVTSVADVNAIKEGLEVGDSLTLSVWRDGEELELEIQLVDKGDIK